MPVPQDKPRTVHYKDLEWKLDPQIFDDFEFTEQLYQLNHVEDVQEGEDGALAIVPLLHTLCGDKYAQVKRVLRDDSTGRIPLENVAGFVADVMNQIAPNS
ncbi:hypothetical protein [Alloscardovia omnicolens]